ncbi:NPCBM/NEW2 domain-containing protein [Candidatus Soleaferrea massiliensis]|uniref:NPCBM/NEW2 domain-containing protein n=1 Tax=Candidatus Soleaferrea massiliensis TaxID=1470354 RepID=UPI00058CB1B6|nr:NPCBM/NEW2 domain-containing protein [Candidatus Soleaferrea massiliensis]
MGDVIQYVEPAKTGDVTLDIYPGKDASSYLYEDDGETFDYETGEYAKTDYAAQTLEGEINIQLSARTGSYAAEDRDYYLNVHTQKEPESVAVDGVSLEKKASMQDVRDSESGYFYDFSKRVIFAKFADDTQAKDIVIKVDTNEVYDGDINAGVSVDYDLKVEDDFRVAYNWSAVGATMTEDVNNGSAVVAVKPEAQSGSISRGFVDINTELYPYFKFKVDSTTGQYAVKMTTGVTETTVYPQSSAGGVFIVPYKELMGLSGVNTIKVTLEAIGENSQTKFGFVKFTGAETGDYMNKTYSLREWVSGGDSQALISYSNPGIKLTNVFSDGHQNPYAGMNRQFVVDIDRTPYLRVNVASYSNASADVKLKTEGTEVSLGSLGTDTTKLYDIRELTGLSGTHIVTVNPAVLGGNGSSVTFDSIEFLNEQDASMETNRTGASWQPDSGRIATSLGTEGVEIRQSGRDVNIDEGWGAVSKDLFIDFSKVSHLKLNLATYSSTLYKLSIRDAEGHSYELKASDDSSVNSIVKLDKAAMQQAGLSVEGMQRYTVVIGMNDFRPTQEGVVTIKAMQFIAAATVDRFDSVYSYEQWSMNDKQAQLSYLNPGLKLTNVMTDTSKNESASVSRSYYVDLDATPYLSISAADFTGGAQYLCKVMVPGSVGETVAITGNSAQTRIINLKALLGLEGLQYVTIIPTVVGGDGAAFTLNAVGFISTVSGEGISGIRIDGEPLQDFAKDRTSYEVNIDSSSSTLPVVSVDKEDDSVEVGIEQATPVSPTAVITVVNKNGEVYTYTINFTDAYATWLSDIDWKSATAGVANGVRKDTSYENPLSLKDADGNVVRYNKGVSAHANATIIYDIRDKGYDAFEAIVGVNALKNDSRSSINIMVYVDGVKAVETGEMKVDTPAKYLNVALTGKSELKLVVDGLGDISADHADFCNAKLLTSQYKVTYASDIDWVSATAGAGTVQKDRSHEFALAVKDAKKNIMLYQKGLGTHAQSEIVYNIEGRNYLKFEAMVGVNAIKNRETSSVNFMVYADGVKVYESGTLKVNDAAKRVSVNLEGVKELKLVSDKADGSIDSDHADWCDAKFLGVRGDDPQPPDVKDFEMRDNWTIVNEDDLYYHIDSKDQITMTATQGDFSSGIRNAKNIVVSDVSGDYTVTTRLKFSPDTRYQTAGLMIYGDNDNYFSAFKRFHPSFGGNCFTANHLHNMDFSEQPVSDPHPDQDVWLKIEKNGTLFVASYSYDNENWTEIGRKDNPDLASMQMKAGIYAVASTIDTTPDIPAVFSEYKVNGEPVLFGYKPQVREGYGELGLRENWSVVRENPEKYTVNEDGSITLTCVLGDLTGGAGSSAQNMVMTPVSGDFTTKVKVAFANPDTVFQTAGFVIYGDDNTSFAITKRFHNAFGGNCFSANNLDNGSFSEQPKPDTQAADDVWMKIEKTGNLFIASISYDDETWTEIGRKENAALAGMDMKVGIYSGYGGVGIVAPEIPATFRDLGVNGELLPFGVFKEAISSEHFNEKYGEVTVLENLGYSAFLSLFGQQKGEIVLKDAEGNAVKGNVQNGYTMELVVDGAVTDRADIITTNDVDVEAGDVDYSGSRGVADLLMVKSYILQRTDFAKWQFEAADVNKDGIINIFDLVEIKFMILRG